MKKIIDNETYCLELENNILIIVVKTAIIDLKCAQEIVAARQKFTEGKEHPVFIKLQSFQKVTKEARDFIGSAEGCKGILAGVIFVNSILVNIVANIFMLLNPAPFPSKIFKDEQKAKQWLSRFVK